VVPYRVPPGAQTGAPPPSGASIPAPPPGANAKKWRETYTEQVAKGLAPGPPPTGFEFVNPANPGAGIRATPGGPATHVPADLAARVAAMDVAVADLPKAREVLQRQWSIQEKAHAAAGVGKIGEAQRAVRFAVEAALRAMSGAGVPDSEVTRYAQIFTPGQTDSVETARSKLDMLDRFLQGARSNAMQGRQSDPGAGGAPPSAPRVRRYNPQTGGLE
jgi:hypothetical protein